MKKKIFVLVTTLVMISTTITIPREINVTAADNYGDPDLDHEYINTTTKELTDIVKNPYFKNWGRYFGRPGEREAADYIEGWMKNLSLDCVHQEPIDSYWPFEESEEVEVKLNRARVMKIFYLNITVRNPITNALIEYKNLSYTECFPYFQHQLINKLDYLLDFTYNEIPVVEKFSRIPLPQMEICETHYSTGYQLNEHLENYDPNFRWFIGGLPWYRGYIAIDNDTDAFFQSPEYDQGKNTMAWGESQGFYVNGSVGKWIRENLQNQWRKVSAKYKTYWKYELVDSYNVIGQINGTDTNKTNIVCAHYDGMPGQACIDEAAETALVLGIAKYIKDHELESDLKHTVKFIAFGAEETGMRGAKDYIKKHVEDEGEIVSCVINPGNFGSYNRTGINYYGKPITMDYELASNKIWLEYLSKDIADALDYTPRTALTGNGTIKVVPSNDLVAEDSLIFAKPGKDYSEACVQFRRSPYSGYHRDGENHTAGDIFSGLDQDTFDLESEVVASVALHLLLNLDYQFENCTFTPVDLEGDGYNDSVNITVNMSTNNNATLLGKSLGGLYNSVTGLLSSDIEDTTLIPLSKGSITTANLTLTLMPDKTAGNYTANLSLFDPLGDLHEECNQTFYLYPINRPYADFDYIKTNFRYFHFYDSSIPSPNANNIVSWNWSFGDGNYSNLQNPSHTYANDGDYDVTLTVVDDQSLTDDVNICVNVKNNPPAASFTMNTNVACVNTAITFTSTSSDDGSISNTKWYYGDGTTDNGNSVQHSYSRSDKYTVTMEVTDNDGCVNSTSDVVYIAGALVDDSYPGDNPSEKKWDTIQEGIDNVSDNELVYVFNGEYTSSVTVDKPISIYGEEGGNTFINNTFSTAIGVAITSDHSIIDGFTIENDNIGIRINGLNSSFISNCNILNSTTGIKIENSASGNIIVQCNFTNNTYGVFITGSEYNIVGSFCDVEQPVLDDSMFLLNDYGVYLENADNNYIWGCTINATGVVSDPRLPPPSTWGICLDNSDNNTITLCDIFDASNYGMYLGGSMNNNITNCIIRKNNKGIYLSGSSGNSIIGNNISENTFAGVSILTMSSTGNSVFWNDFIRNGIITRVQAEDFGTGNNWNSSENITFMHNGSAEGNHWDDYTGTDSNNGDGIGDTPYYIAGTANAEDDYPVMEEYGWMYKWL
ncbi:hypothetical protein AYK20_05135 [Thermoplasmatales archaeon SG8-52-1]|nr:MAG: hypothetical protein AYK20_05135 [Thermoplasmatales archaeon SG8-52-1]